MHLQQKLIKQFEKTAIIQTRYYDKKHMSKVIKPKIKFCQIQKTSHQTNLQKN